MPIFMGHSILGGDHNGPGTILGYGLRWIDDVLLALTQRIVLVSLLVEGKFIRMCLLVGVGNGGKFSAFRTEHPRGASVPVR